MVDSSHSTSPPVQMYYHPASSNVEPPFNSLSIHIFNTMNTSSIGREPVSCARPLGTSIAKVVGNKLLNQLHKAGLINIVNVLQVDEIIVLVCCTIE